MNDLVDLKMGQVEERIMGNEPLMKRLSEESDPAVARGILQEAFDAEVECAKEEIRYIIQAESEAVRQQALSGKAFTIH